MADRTISASPQFYARIAGILYLLIIIGGIFAEIFVRQHLVVVRDPAATAANILAHETLYRLGFAAGAIVVMCAVPVLFILYHLFNRVNKSFAILAVFFNLSSIAIESVNQFCEFSCTSALTVPLHRDASLRCGVVTLWLLIKGVNAEQWEKRTLASA